MVQTPAEDFSRVYSPNVTQTLDQRVPGVFISDAQGNEFTSDLRYRGFTASPLQGRHPARACGLHARHPRFPRCPKAEAEAAIRQSAC
jgi:hypothetical protein